MNAAMMAMVERAKACAEARKNRPAESFWPNVRKWLSTGEGNQPLPACLVCYKELDVKGIGPVPSLDGDGTAGETAPAAAVLPCGHMMCHNCTLTGIDELGNRPSTCPVCREPCQSPSPSSCKHHIHWHVATSAAKQAYAKGWVPKTIPEGGKLPHRCVGCIGKVKMSRCCYYHEISNQREQVVENWPNYFLAVTYDTLTQLYTAEVRLNDQVLRTSSGPGWVDIREQARSQIIDDWLDERISPRHRSYLKFQLRHVQAVPEHIVVQEEQSRTIPILIVEGDRPPYIGHRHWPRDQDPEAPWEDDWDDSDSDLDLDSNVDPDDDRDNEPDEDLFDTDKSPSDEYSVDSSDIRSSTDENRSRDETYFWDDSISDILSSSYESYESPSESDDDSNPYFGSPNPSLHPGHDGAQDHHLAQVDEAIPPYIPQDPEFTYPFPPPPAGRPPTPRRPTIENLNREMTYMWEHQQEQPESGHPDTDDLISWLRNLGTGGCRR